MSWEAPGTLIHGSFDASAEFVHVNAGQVVTPLHRPVSGVVVLAMADNFSYSGAVTGVETTLGGNWTLLKGNYGDMVTLTNPHGGGWEANGDDYTLQNTISVSFGKLKNALRPVYGGVASTTLKHTGTAGGGGQVFVSVSDDGESPYCPYPYAASSPRYAATSWVPHYAFFGGAPNPGWVLYAWHSSATKKPFELDPLYIFRDTAVAATAEFLPAARLSWEATEKGGSGAAAACLGYCVANPAAAYYSGNTVVRVTASAQPGYVFSHWEGSGTAWTTATGSNGNWTVTGAGAALKGQTSATVYVKMGDDAVKPRPKDRDLMAVFEAPVITPVLPPEGAMEPCTAGDTGDPMSYGTDSFGNTLTIQCEAGSYYFKYNGQETGKCFRTCGDNVFRVEKITYPDGKWAFWGAFHSVRDNPCIAHYFQSQAGCDDDPDLDGPNPPLYVDWRARYTRFLPWDEWVMDCKKMITDFGTPAPNNPPDYGLGGSDCQARRIDDTFDIKTRLSDEDMGYLGPGNMICQSQFECP